jgi:hypothetical protein
LLGAWRDPHPFPFGLAPLVSCRSWQSERRRWFAAVSGFGVLRSDWLGFDYTRRLSCGSHCLVRATPSVRPNNSFKPTPLRGFLASFSGTL